LRRTFRGPPPYRTCVLIPVSADPLIEVYHRAHKTTAQRRFLPRNRSPPRTRSESVRISFLITSVHKSADVFFRVKRQPSAGLAFTEFSEKFFQILACELPIEGSGGRFPVVLKLQQALGEEIQAREFVPRPSEAPTAGTAASASRKPLRRV
jgi:hypothetical protein